MSEGEREVHQSDSESFEADSSGFYVPRCECGWTFGQVPDLETLCDVLMSHAAERAGAE